MMLPKSNQIKSNWPWFTGKFIMPIARKKDKDPFKYKTSSLSPDATIKVPEFTSILTCKKTTAYNILPDTD